MTKEYRYIGKATPRKDARDIITGRAQYIDDMKLPGMLYGKVLGSPYSHARIKSIDTSRAMAQPGVKAVLTYKNAPDWKLGMPPHKPVLDSTVRFVGDVVALVAADTADIARGALRLIDVEYEPLPAVYDAETAIQPDSPQLYPDLPGNLLPRGTYGIGPKALQEIVMGDVAKGFEEADLIVEGECAYDNIPNPLPPEPPGVIASWDGPDKLTLWTASQSAGANKSNIQNIMGRIDVRVIGTQCGGSYGSKNANQMPVAYATALARATNRPVKLYYTKEEHFDTFSLRLGSRIRASIGIKKDGTVTAVAGEWIIDTGASSEVVPWQVAVGCGEAQLMLRCPNWNIQPRAVCTNRNPSGVVRGFGGQELKSSLIPILSIAMEKIDIDPVEFFKKNFVKPGDGYYWRDGAWVEFRGPDYSKAIEKGAEVFGWKDKWRGWGKPTAACGTKRRGIGVGIHGNADVGEDESEAWVRLDPDGRAVVFANISESGPSQRSSVCKMAAEVLNLPLESVDITPPDTLVNPFEFGLVGSRGTYILGAAVIEAAEDVKRQLFELAAPLLGAGPEDLETEDASVYHKAHPEKRLSWRRVIGKTRTCIGRGRTEHDFSLPNMMTIFAEVEVDIETGKTDLLRVVATTDCGQIIDPLVLQGQLQGSIGSAGIDTALAEETILDNRNGHILNGNMIDYKWRTFVDLPEFQTVILETPFPSHRFHAIGVGEIAPAPGPSAVLMAVYNAIGQRIMSYPLTPDKILKALDKE